MSSTTLLMVQTEGFGKVEQRYNVQSISIDDVICCRPPIFDTPRCRTRTRHSNDMKKQRLKKLEKITRLHHWLTPYCSRDGE